jgi:hypothetical protein
LTPNFTDNPIDYICADTKKKSRKKGEEKKKPLDKLRGDIGAI